jgi:hypothetical protein
MSQSNTRTLSNEVAQKLAAQALERMPFAKLAFWPNRNKREGKRDADLSGQITISTVEGAELFAKALAEGKTTVSFWADMWVNEASVKAAGNDRPTLSGRARNVVEDRSAQSDATTNEIASLLRQAAGQ